CWSRLTRRPSPIRGSFVSASTGVFVLNLGYLHGQEIRPRPCRAPAGFHGRRCAGVTAMARCLRSLPAVSHEPDQTVVEGVSPVDYGRLVRLLVVEQVEVVTDEFHLVEGVVDGHRLSVVFLRPDDATGTVLGFLLAVAERQVGRDRELVVLGEGRGGFRHGHGRLLTVGDLAALLRPAQTRFELADHRLEGSVEAVGPRLGAYDRSLSAGSDLDPLTTLLLTPVAFVLQLDVEDEDRRIETFEPSEFLGDVDPEMIGDLDVASFHDNVGTGAFRGGIGLCNGTSGLRRGRHAYLPSYGRRSPRTGMIYERESALARNRKNRRFHPSTLLFPGLMATVVRNAEVCHRSRAISRRVAFGSPGGVLSGPARGLTHGPSRALREGRIRRAGVPAPTRARWFRW